MPTNEPSRSDSTSLRAAVEANPLWYHTMELAPGVVTPGWFDLRPIVAKLPWPDVRGKRCLDVGTYDGFLAFEMERRGASYVLATDIGSHEEWDWPPAVRAQGHAVLAQLAGEKGSGFEIAARAVDSKVEKREISVYDLTPEGVGTFDVVVCGSLLLHLRDPLRALEAIRSVCTSHFMSSEQIDVELTVLHPRTPLTRLNAGANVQWHVPNVAGHRRMIRAAGFEVLRGTRPFSIPFGPGHRRRQEGVRLRRKLIRRLATGGVGVPHAAVLAKVS